MDAKPTDYAMKKGDAMKNMIRGLLFSLTLILSSCGSIPAGPSGVIEVACENGVMLGKSDGNVVSFKGVPYAKPPVGPLRWKAPVALEPSDKRIECFEYGYTALQYQWPTEPASTFPKSEDCLTLNIWERENSVGSKRLKPVMVFFHGGAYGWGGTTDPVYDGFSFAQAHDDVLLVTCNYRLGIMAFPDFSKIEGGENYQDVNLALRDHIAALTWLQRNIARFGGDPRNVTIFGESAGAWSVTALLLSPKARGLFQRVIAQSGEAAPKPRQAAQDYADYIMEVSGAKNMEDLLAISAEEWMKLDEEHNIADENCYLVVDDDTLPSDMDQAFIDAASSGVELVMGSNLDEWNYFKNDSFGDTDQEKFASWVEDMDRMYEEVYDAADEQGKTALAELLRYEESLVPEEYAGKEDTRKALAKSGFVSEMWRYEILDFAERFAKAGGKVWSYLWKIPSTREDMYRSAVHGVELGYVFNNLADNETSGVIDASSARKVQDSWISFARLGDPSIQEVRWGRYGVIGRDTMVIEKDGWHMESDPSFVARELLQTVYGDHPYHVW